MIDKDNFFKEKNVHSKIKHRLFEDTFRASLNIANKFSKNIEGFIYCDLYAGQGEFDSGEAGSPKIALSVIEHDFENIKNLSLKLFFVEQDSIRFEKLRNTIESNIYKIDRNSIDFYEGRWEDIEDNLKDILSRYKWGFIFIDPFANEIDFNKIASILENENYKDIMLFINLQSLRRLYGNNQTKKSVINFLNLSNDLDFKKPDLFFKSVRDSIKISGKSYNLLVALPSSRDGKRTNSDYFALLCSTNSIGVADTFIKSYIDIVKEEKKEQIVGLFGKENIKNRIIELLPKEDNRYISLIELYSKLSNEVFISWKEIDITEAPTSDNILKAINQLLKENRIIVNNSPKELWSKNGDRLLKKSIQKNMNMRKIKLAKK